MLYKLCNWIGFLRELTLPQITLQFIPILFDIFDKKADFNGDFSYSFT